MNTSLEQCLVHLEALVACDTTNPPRDIASSGLLEYLQSLPYLDPEISDLGGGSFNIMLSKGSPKHLFNVHLDTVPVSSGWDYNPHHLTIDDGKAYGLGACDIKGAAACLLALIESGLSDYAVLFSTDEEAGQSTCIQEFLKSKPSYEGIIVCEPTQNLAVTCHRGIATGSIKFEGIAGHSSDKRAMQDNAIHKLARWSNQALIKAQEYDSKSIENLSGIAFNLGVIEGGIKPNVIADRASVKFGFRPLPGQQHTDILDSLGINDLPDTSVFAPGFIAPSLPADGDIDRLKSLASSLGLQHSAPVNFWTEASLFSQAGYPAIVLGPGNIKHAHQPNEHVELDDLSEAMKLFAGILQ